MTIEKEALLIAKNFQGTKMDSYAFALLQEQIGKALQKKQDRIEELEKEILNLKYVSHTSRDFMKLIDQDKNLKKIAELEHLLHDHSDEVLRTCYQKIKTLESALKEALDYIPDKELFDRAKKAIVGNCD